ncbi:MAG: transposase [Oscillospiraceae bacterium]|nr:transposase [Oscillospiraceae bacterium]
MALPERKKLRLEGYNYSQNGVYFITICAKNKEKLFGEVVGDGVPDVPRVELSPIGETVDKYILSIEEKYDYITIEKYVIMPNHIHLLIMVYNCDNAITSGANSAIPRLISTLKRFVNKEVGIDVWQRSYHDHIVRNERDYDEIWQYIDENPLKWKLDCYY